MKEKVSNFKVIEVNQFTKGHQVEEKLNEAAAQGYHFEVQFSKFILLTKQTEYDKISKGGCCNDRKTGSPCLHKMDEGKVQKRVGVTETE